MATSDPKMEGVKSLKTNQQQNMPRCSIKLTLLAHTSALHSVDPDRCMTAACNRKPSNSLLIRNNGAVVYKNHQL